MKVIKAEIRGDIRMARTTVYNTICSKDSLDKIDAQNKFLKKEFLEYLKSVGKAATTIDQYGNDLNIFFCWNFDYNDNKPFIKITKREFAKFQNNALNEWQWSPKRIRRVKATLSSLSNFIENILDEEEEFKDYRSVIRKIESPVDTPVREKTVFEPEELQQLLDKLVESKKYEAACALSLAMSSARRKSELTRFKVSYFTDDNVIHGSLYKTPEKVVTKGRGVNGKLLYLYVLKKSFDPYLKLWMDERKEKGIESEWLFPKLTDMNEHVSVDTFDTWAEWFTKLTGRDFYWHSIRHYATTEFRKNNIPTDVVQELIGWESADMVNLYTDISADDKIGQYFDENGIKQVKETTLAEL